jgi:hypothetical protein
MKLDTAGVQGSAVGKLVGWKSDVKGDLLSHSPEGLRDT